MYRINNKENFDFLINQELIQLVIGEFSIELRFTHDVAISVESDFQHYTIGDRLLTTDRALPLAAASLISLLGKSITACYVIDDRTLQISFSNQERIYLFDMNEDAESFRIVSKTIEITV